MVAPTLETGILSAGVSVVTFFELCALFGLAFGLGVMGADPLGSAKVEGAGVSVVTVVVSVAVFGTLDGKVDAFSRDCIAAIRRAPVVIVAVGACDAELCVA